MIRCTDEDGEVCGKVEVDHTDSGVLLEVFDSSHIDGTTVISAVTYMSPVEADQIADALRPGRQSGDRQLPPPYDKLSADERSTWLVLEGLYDGALTDDVRRANAGRTMTPWAELQPEAQRSLATILLQVVPMLHAVALNPAARASAQAVASDG